MRYLKVLGEFINIDEIISIDISEGEKAGEVNIKYKDIRGDTNIQTLMRKTSYVADPLTVNEIRETMFLALKDLKDNDIVNFTDYMKEEGEQ